MATTAVALPGRLAKPKLLKQRKRLSLLPRSLSRWWIRKLAKRLCGISGSRTGQSSGEFPVA